MAIFEIPDGYKIEEGGVGAFIVDGKKILLAKYKGKYYAINSICPHQGGDLSSGVLEGKNLICPRHGHKIDITTGKHAGFLSASFIKSPKDDGRSYRVITKGSTLKIEI